MQRRLAKSLLKKPVVSPKNHFLISSQPRTLFTKYSEPTSFSQNFDNSLDPSVIRYHHAQIVEKFNRFFSKEAKETKEPESKSTEEKKQENQEKQQEQEKQEAKTEEKKKDEENSDKQDDKEKSNRDMFSILTNLFFAGGILYVALSLGGKQTAPAEAQEITFQQLVQKYVGTEELHHLVYDLKSNKVYVYLTKDISSENPVANPRYSYFVNVLSQTDFEHKIQDAEERMKIPATQRTKIIYKGGFNTSEVISTVIEALIFFGLPVLLFRRFGRGGKGSDGGSMLDIFGVGKVGSKTSHNIKTTFADVAGMREAKLEIQEFVSILKSPEKYRKLGAKTPRGAILMGPPGTGKTLLAKAVAGESKVPFFSISGSDFVEMFVGVGPARVRDLFKRAREAKDAIIYIDEIDAIGRPRGMNSMYGGGNDERENTLNQLLVEMDGMNENHNIVILASTNVEKDGLDKALLRPGRFDRQIVVDKPDQQEREEVFQVHLKPLKLAEEVKTGIHRLAQLTPGFSGADIANVCNEAAIYAAREGREEVTMANMEKAVERVVGGLEKKNMPILPEDKKVIAFHEAGHAIVSWFLKYCDPLLKISIIPRGKALGYAQYLPAERYIRTYDHLMDIISQALGGRVAEKLIFDHFSTGAKDDLQKITRIAYMAVSSFGMSNEVGLLSFPPPGDPSISVQKPYSEETARKIDEEARKIISVGYARAEQILTEKKDMLYKVAEYLLIHETMSMEQFKAIVGPRPHEAVAAAPEQNAVAGTTEATETTSASQQQ